MTGFTFPSCWRPWSWAPWLLAMTAMAFRYFFAAPTSFLLIALLLFSPLLPDPAALSGRGLNSSLPARGRARLRTFRLMLWPLRPTERQRLAALTA